MTPRKLSFLTHHHQGHGPQPPNILLGASIGFCAIAYGFALLLIAVLAIHSVPNADDFCYASKALRHGLLGAVENEYNTWSGRYSSTFIMAWFTLNLDWVQHYWLVTASVVTSIVAGIVTLIWALTLRPRMAFVLCLPIFVVMVAALPKPGEVLFWLAGGVTYGIGMGLLLIWFSGMIALLRTTQPHNLKQWILFSFLSGFTVILPGFQESIMLMVAASAFIFTAASVKISRPWNVRLKFIFIFVLSLAAGFFVAQNPGSAIRAENYMYSGHLLLMPVVQVLLMIITLILVVPAQLGLWASTLCVSGLWPETAIQQKNQPAASIRMSQHQFWILIAAVLCIIAAANFAPTWGIGGPPSPRAFTPQYIFGFMCVVGLLLAFTPAIQTEFFRLRWHHTIRNRLLALVLCLHALAILSNDFIGQAVTNLIIGGDTPAADYKAQWAERFEKIQTFKNKGEKKLAFKPLKHKPSLLHVDDIGVQNSWTSRCFSSYWGVESIHLIE